MLRKLIVVLFQSKSCECTAVVVAIVVVGKKNISFKFKFMFSKHTPWVRFVGKVHLGVGICDAVPLHCDFGIWCIWVWTVVLRYQQCRLSVFLPFLSRRINLWAFGGVFVFTIVVFLVFSGNPVRNWRNLWVPRNSGWENTEIQSVSPFMTIMSQQRKRYLQKTKNRWSNKFGL